jgi:mono/diheme cytochrome c family protein
MTRIRYINSLLLVASALAGGAVVCGSGAGCKDKRFEENLRLGGRTISAKTLNEGHRHYTTNCEACHGERGDGQGPAAPGTVPPPRDFTQGFFKYISVPDDGLPTDEDLMRSAKRGVPGTRMPAWTGMPDDDLHATIHYLKTFSPRWRKRAQGEPIPRKPDPWRGQASADPVRKRGELVYHGAAQCWTCHPSYRSRAGLMQAVRRYEKEQGKAPPQTIPIRGGLHRPAIVDTRYGKLAPPDFLDHTLRGGDSNADLYRTVAAGIGGTPMPTWFNRLPPRDLWAAVHYVRHLLRLQDTPEGKALQKKMKAWGRTGTSARSGAPSRRRARAAPAAAAGERPGPRPGARETPRATARPTRRAHARPRTRP